MNGEQIWLAAAAGGAVALILLLACALLWRTSRRLHARIDELEAEQGSAPRPAAAVETAEPATYVITAIDEVPETHTAVVPARIDGRLFADIVARESVVKAAGLAHGLRRALSAETRNRIRFEMKREVKRSRKQRRADLKAALRELQARERAGTLGEDAA
ncbi:MULTISPECIES: hypothetical protein [Nocardioides]|uniref:hypothetical protein n=1 Tax=Nocardioides TaxID=1839 RepID=UPI00032F7ED0|nr:MULTISPECIES: hypothetical protein [Nocardioides]EON24141.1 hypothetical protein CF8_1904 [Nocardioides sp. CF8]